MRANLKTVGHRLCVLLLFMVGWEGWSQSAPAYRFKIATIAPDRSVWINAYNEMADEIGRISNGAIKFTCYPGGVQGDEHTVMRKIRIGQLQGAGFTGIGIAKICKEALVLQLPYMFKTYQEFEYVFQRMKGILEEACEKEGYYALGWPHFGFVYLFSSDMVQDIGTLRIAKPWAIEDDILSKSMFSIAGVSAVSAQIGDVLTGLRSGLIRTIYAPPVGMITLQWFTKIKYRVDLAGAYTFGTFVVDKKKWDQIPAALQKNVATVCNTHFDRLNEKVRQQNQDALELMEKNDIETISLSEKGLQEFGETSQRVAEQLSGSAFSRDSLVTMQQLLTEYRQSTVTP